MTPDLLAESRAAGMHGARAEAAVYAAMLPLPLPDQRQADVRVFGEWGPSGPVDVPFDSGRRLACQDCGSQWRGAPGEHCWTGCGGRGVLAP